MKTIKIFLASSEELKDERNTMADLILHLNKLFRGRGLELDLEKWEYLDASMTGKRKQDEYNEVLKQCDICMVLFWRKFGSFTGEELDTAYNRMKQKEKPHKIYVFFKNPNSDELTQELKDFIANYEQRFGGHFFCKFQNVDTMKLEFLLQLENYQKDLIGEKAIEVRNEHVYVGNEAMVDLNNIPFAANNERFKERQAELKELENIIEKKRKELDEKNTALQIAKDQQANLPNVAGLQMFVDMAQKAVTETEDSLQELLDRKNKLKEEFEREQQNLFNTARRITEQRGHNISERMARAIEAFERGDAQRADIILDEAEKDFEEARKDFRITKKVSIQALEEQIQRASYKMSNDSIPIEERVAKTLEIYEEADAFAQEINYDQKKFIDFLLHYSKFLRIYAHYDKAIDVYNRLIKLCEDVYGKDNSVTAWSYNNIGIVYYNLSEYNKALEYFKLALDIKEKVWGKEHPDTAKSYNNIGIVHNDRGEYDKALEYYKRASDIRERVLGKEHPETAGSYDNIGSVYSDLGEYDKALEYHKKALVIEEKVLGKEHPETAPTYNNIGIVYKNRGDYDKALEYHKKALVIEEKVFGKEHPDTATSYNNIGIVYSDRGEYDKALEYYKRALDIREKVLGQEHPDTAASYDNIGCVYYNRGDYDKALEYHKKALVIEEKVLGKEHPDTANSYNNIGLVFSNLGEYDKALEYHKKALDIRENVLGKEHPDTVNSYHNIGLVYYKLSKYDKALEWYTKAAKQGYKYSYNELAWAYHLMDKYEEALPWAEKAVAAFPDNANIIDTLATVYQGLGRYKEALQQFELCLKLYKEQGSLEGIQETEAKIAELKEILSHK